MTMDAPQATILLPCLYTGGTEVATLETARAFRDLGFRTRIVVYFDEVDPEMRRAFAGSGIEVQELGQPRREGRYSALTLTSRLIGVLASRRNDVIWVQYMTPSLLPLLVARLFTRKLLGAVHVAAAHYSPAGRRRIRWIARLWFWRFVCVSDDSARGLFGERLPARVCVLPNTFRQDEVAAAPPRNWREELGWPAAAVLVGYVGRLSRNKGPDVLLEAMAHVEPGDLDVRAVFVGDGAERQALEGTARALGIAHRVAFAGRLSRTDVFGALKGFDIVAVPSREEGFGLSALEAMAAGVPVVASSVGALRQLVIDGASGLLFKTEDAAELATRIVQLAIATEHRQSLGRAARARAMALFGEERYRAGVRDLLGPVGKGATT